MRHSLLHSSRFTAACGLLMTLWIGVSSATSAADSPRTALSLDQGWRFHIGNVTDAIDPGYDDHEWRRVDVPHDYVVEGMFHQTNHFVYPGKIIGVGNGDLSCHEPDQCIGDAARNWKRSMFNGLAQVILQSQRGGSGNLVLRAKAEGLKPAETTISVEATPLYIH
jgi:hypothetical protein